MFSSLYIPISSCLVNDQDDPSTDLFDPALFIQQIPIDYFVEGANPIVRIQSDVISEEMKLDIFLSKQHRVEGSYILFGYKKFDIKDLIITVGVKSVFN
jgi:hypothetical protein